MGPGARRRVRAAQGRGGDGLVWGPCSAVLGQAEIPRRVPSRKLCFSASQDVYGLIMHFDHAFVAGRVWLDHAPVRDCAQAPLAGGHLAGRPHPPLHTCSAHCHCRPPRAHENPPRSRLPTPRNNSLPAHAPRSRQTLDPRKFQSACFPACGCSFRDEELTPARFGGFAPGHKFLNSDNECGPQHWLHGEGWLLRHFPCSGSTAQKSEFMSNMFEAYLANGTAHITRKVEA
jgi:hypothetical protein